MADAFKNAGNEAFKNKDYDEAVSQFTKAIEADGTNHVLYSNRSGAYAAKGEFKNALLDANKCIDLKGDWAKGHSRRGAAYFGLKNWIQAQASYERGLELDPSSQVMKDELAKVKARRQGGGGGGGGFDSRAAAAASAAASAAAGTATGGPATAGIAPMLSLMAITSGALYTFPILGAARAFQCYRLAVGNILMLFIVNLWNNFPKKLATISDPKFRGTQEAQAFFLCVFMMLSPPMPFGLMPFLSVAFVNAVHAYSSTTAKLPDFLSSRIAWFATAEGTFQAHAFGAVSEVIVCFMSPMLIVVQGQRAAMLSFFFFQYVARRYKTNPQTVTTVKLLVERLDGFAHHRFVPAPVGVLYGRVKSGVAWASSKLQ